ncbi:hypothetical protein M406DRAFT_249862 [Cryphonectria parasitica EP155]|uniref:Uncharacterized protein n=1 Tax=Cryphonectria parasitica (strain ATCC 38755 / EP155) TaxID=660469 RepID=A0A9P4Y8B0_CRYP1|nr:uncharacterized protein M406DRAFT_249862 [Cryphonectria parasitica EP155]KAF3768819.1 hypothetical protein M406DRAFT_249862 [Cryphonectria parasitica EP155]
MTEAWDYLAVQRAQHARCAEDVSQLTAACARDHPRYKHVLECRECYGKVIDRMRSRYMGPSGDAPREWFSGRDGLLRDLDSLFASAREYEGDLERIDARIDLERRRWYEQQVRASPSIGKALRELLEKKDVLDKIGTKGVDFEQIVSEVREALKGPGTTNGEAITKKKEEEEEADIALDRLVEVTTPEARIQVYKETFFQETSDEKASAKIQTYLQRLQEGATMDEIINKISVDRRSSIGAQGQKEQHRQRAEELRRAKNAHELQKSKKATGRKGSQPKPPQIPDEMYEQPPCHNCGRNPDLQDYMICPLCQVLVEGGVRAKPTVFCSSACFSGNNGLKSHVETTHDCAGGDNCVQLVDEDTEMDMDGSGPFLCKECLNDFRKGSVYCSVRCADLNFQRHRQGVHFPERKQRDLDVDRDASALHFVDDSKTKYRPQNIRSHLASLKDLLNEFQHKNAIEATETIWP